MEFLYPIVFFVVLSLQKMLGDCFPPTLSLEKGPTIILAQNVLVLKKNQNAEDRTTKNLHGWMNTFFLN